MKLTTQLLATLTSASLLTACAGTPVPLGSRVTDAVVGTAKPITAEACGFQLLLFIPIALNSRLERAYGALQTQADGAVITDVEVQEDWTYGFVGTSYCTRLRAKAVKPD